MKTLFIRIAECIGKYIDESIVQRLFDDLETSPEIQERPNGRSRLYTFKEFGLGIVMHLVENRWLLRGAGIALLGEKSCILNAHEPGSNLPPNISADDSREIVKEKMGAKYIDSVILDDGKRVRDCYTIQSLDFELTFENDSGKMTSWMLSKSIALQ